MPRVRNAIRPVSFEPESLGEIFDEVWRCEATNFADHQEWIEVARIRLATIILDLAKDGQLGRDQIARTATRLIRAAAPKTRTGD
jgi:hypothetical protein